MVRRWEFPSVQELLVPSEPDARWSISTREFREDLQWAVVLGPDGEITDAVASLLDELRARGITPACGAGIFPVRPKPECP